MPITPLHFGPSGIIALPLNRYLDIPAFLLANVAIDLEPLTVMLLSLSYPLHGYAHSLIGSAIICLVLGLGLFHYKNLVEELMGKYFKKSYAATRIKVLFSAVLGGWLHVFLDSILYFDIKPFYPSSYNPLRGVIEHDYMYKICALLIVPALAIYTVILVLERRNMAKNG